jgi:hypothetical protein
MGSRETDRQSADYTVKSQSKADRQAAGRQQQVNRQQSGKTGRQAGMQAGRWLACGKQAACKQAFRSTRSRMASMKQ